MCLLFSLVAFSLFHSFIISFFVFAAFLASFLFSISVFILFVAVVVLALCCFFIFYSKYLHRNGDTGGNRRRPHNVPNEAFALRFVSPLIMSMDSLERIIPIARLFE